METSFSKTHSGYKAESMSTADANGHAWQIYTCKGSNGTVTCSATQGQFNGSMFSYEMFGAKRMTLASLPGKCTENLVKEVHALGLAKFAEFEKEQAQNSPEPYIVAVGQVLFTDGLESERRRAVYKIESPGRYKTVLLDGSAFTFDDHVKPYNEKFGIGTYYREGDVISADQVADLVKQATEATAKKEEDKQKASELAELERIANIETGRKVISEIPAGVVAVIVAELHKDDSDMMSDYSNYTTEKIVYLSFSTHDRDLFPELRKAAAKFEHTQKYAVAPAMPEGADAEYWKPRDEHREKYSMGSGYYLGDSKYSGWIVRKRSLRYLDNALETLQIAAATDRYLCNVEEVKEEKAPANYEKIETKPGELQIIDYSEKAIAVIGETKPIKDQLSSLGGKFNARLSCGPGWIFSKKRLDAVQKFLQNLTAVAA